MWQREELVKKLIELIRVEVLPKLTERQRQITKMYLLNEKEIAEILAISQPTVSQHLFGKKRNGKKVGGSIRKIRKIILKKSCCQQSEYLKTLQRLLDAKMSLTDKKSLLEQLRM